MKLIEYFYCKGRQGFYFVGTFEGQNLSYDMVYICTTPNGYRIGSQDIENLDIHQFSPKEIINRYSDPSCRESKNPLDNDWSREDIVELLDQGEECPC
ncbi:hypothetical protein [Orenia marismortui]|uniref:hypothetical protein n=1 Tax=Orenia marismortui TaxID=46469 RepID=UPI00037EFCC9|nr:hypothetical protein [Orenia marismortui]